tara:strand:+ start:6138 stop:6974 length:837 start_codon:yes stop_codon:yes gene_type:complete
MTSLYYEQCVVNSPKVTTKELIKLSEHQRAFNKTPTIKSAQIYLEKFKKLIHTVRYRRVQLKSHPTFTYKSVKSANWTVELLRIATTYRDLLLEKADETEDLKEKNRMLLQALQVSNDCSRYSTSILFDTDRVKTLKELNPQYHLSRTLSIAADRFFNMNTYKNNGLAIKRAFQLKELSYLLWKNEGDIEDVIKYKALALLSMTSKMQDDDCGQKIALLEGIVTKDACPEEVKTEYEKLMQQNRSVYYTPVTTDKTLETISLEEAFHILSKCFESPST